MLRINKSVDRHRKINWVYFCRFWLVYYFGCGQEEDRRTHVSPCWSESCTNAIFLSNRSIVSLSRNCLIFSVFGLLRSVTSWSNIRKQLAEELRAKELRVQGLRAQDMRVQELRAKDIQVQELRVQVLPAIRNSNYLEEFQEELIHWLERRALGLLDCRALMAVMDIEAEVKALNYSFRYISQLVFLVVVQPPAVQAPVQRQVRDDASAVAATMIPLHWKTILVPAKMVAIVQLQAPSAFPIAPLDLVRDQSMTPHVLGCK